MALPQTSRRSELKPGARVHHRCFPAVHRADDLLRGDSLQVGAGRREVCRPQLALNQRQRDPLMQELDSVRMPQLMGRKPAPDPPQPRGGASRSARRWHTTRDRRSAHQSHRTAVPAAVPFGPSSSWPRLTMPTGLSPPRDARSPFPCRISRLPRRRENQTLRMEREILKKAAAFSPGKPASRRRDLRAGRGGEDEFPVGGDVPDAGGEPHQLSRLGSVAFRLTARCPMRG